MKAAEIRKMSNEEINSNIEKLKAELLADLKKEQESSEE